MYQPQQNQAKISPGLSALMELQRTAAATTPDGTPTIASQVAQKVQGMQGQGQEQPQAPQGIAGIAPNLPPQIQNALVGGQIQQQQQQQAQQAMMQMAQQQAAAQKPPGPLQLAQGGIAALPADNMHNMGRYAHGGVIGFAGDGEEGSKVPKSDKEKEAEAKQILMDQLNLMRLPAAAADVFQAPVAGLANLGGSALSGIQNFSNRAINALMGSKNLPTDKDYNPNYSLTPFYDKIRAAEEKANKTTVDIPEVKQPALERDANGLIIQDPTAQASPAVQAPPASDRGIAQTLPRPRPAAVVAKPPAAAAGAPQGQVTASSGITAPTLLPFDDKKLTDLAALEERLRTGRKDYEGESITAKEAERAKLKALEDSRAKNYNLNALIAFANAAGGSYRPGAGGAAVAKYEEDQYKTAKENLQAEAMAGAEVRKLKELQHNVKIGDVAAARQNYSEISKLKQDHAKTQAVLDASIYGDKKRAESAVSVANITAASHNYATDEAARARKDAAQARLEGVKFQAIENAAAKLNALPAQLEAAHRGNREYETAIKTETQAYQILGSNPDNVQQKEALERAQITLKRYRDADNKRYKEAHDRLEQAERHAYGKNYINIKSAADPLELR